MANAALVHLYIPPHPSLANRCEILDMAWIWPPGEKKGGWVGLGRGAISTSHSIHITFDFLLSSHAIASLSSYTLNIAHTFTETFGSVGRGGDT